MKHPRGTFSVFFSTLCFSLAFGAWFGSYSLGFFKITETAAKKNVATAVEALPVTRENIRVPILVYHSVRPHIFGESPHQEIYDVTPDLLRRQLEYIKENEYTAISFSMLADYFDGVAALPKKPIILTFDDGWENQYEYAFPLLKEFQDTATFFVFTNAVNRGHHITWEQLREMRDSGVSVEAHTKTHPYLQKITDKDELVREITESKQILEKELREKVTSFAYPFGQYDDASVEEVKKSGFRAARSLRGGVMQNENERYLLRASLVTDNFEDFKRFLEK